MSVVPARDKTVTLNVNDTVYGLEDCRVIATNLLLQWAADFGLIEWTIVDGEMTFYQPQCCDHDCSSE